jgi:hypothetical protein
MSTVPGDGEHDYRNCQDENCPHEGCRKYHAGYDQGFMRGASDGYARGRQAALAVRTAADQVAHGYPDETTLQAAVEAIAYARTAGILGNVPRLIPRAQSLPEASQAQMCADLADATATGNTHTLAAAFRHWHEKAG